MNPPRPAKSNRGAASRERAGGAVLFEVLLSLALFAAAAAVATTALNASMQSLERQKLSSQAMNLAASVMAEIQLGIRPAAADSPRPLEAPLQDWIWEATMTPTETSTGEATGLSRVEVVIRNQKSTVVQRLSQIVRLNPVTASLTAAAAP